MSTHIESSGDPTGLAAFPATAVADLTTPASGADQADADREHGDGGAARSDAEGGDGPAPDAGLVIYAKTARDFSSCPPEAVPDSPAEACALALHFPDASEVSDAGLAVASILGGSPELRRRVPIDLDQTQFADPTLGRAVQPGSGPITYDRFAGALGVIDAMSTVPVLSDPGTHVVGRNRTGPGPRTVLGSVNRRPDQSRQGFTGQLGVRSGTSIESLTFALRIAPGAVTLSVTNPDRAAARIERNSGVSERRLDAAAAHALRCFIQASAGVLGPAKRSEYPPLSGESVAAWFARRAPEVQRELMQAAASAVGAVHLADPGPVTREVTDFSRKSRANLIRAFSELDYSPIIDQPGSPVMVTLTYPGCWLAVAPTGEAAKAHLRAFRARFERRYGPLWALWKLEFQGRGPGSRCHCDLCTPVPYARWDDGRAPHFHLWFAEPTSRRVAVRRLSPLRLLRTKVVEASGCWRVSWREASEGEGTRARQRSFPTREDAGLFIEGARVPVWTDGETTESPSEFRAWLSETWADIVDHPDSEHRLFHALAGTAVDHREGLRGSDPKRLAVYFAKHAEFAAKEYQHIVPTAWRLPGDGPGRFWGYWRLERVAATVLLSPEDFVQIRRTMRRWARSTASYRPGDRYPSGVFPAVVARRVPRGRPRSDGSRRFRSTTRRRRLLASGMTGGFLAVNDGTGFAAALALAVAARR